MSPSVGGNELQNGNIECAAAKIVDRHFAALLFVQTVGKRSSGWLVNQAQDFEASEFASILRGLALRIVEIRGHGDHGAIDRFTEVGFGPILQFAQNERRNFGRREDFIAELNTNDVLDWLDRCETEIVSVRSVRRPDRGPSIA